MPRIKADLHSHTSASHGIATAREMYASAGEHNLEYFGISEHSPLPDGFQCHLYTGDLARDFPLLNEEISEIQGKSPGFPIMLRGLELDWLPSKRAWMLGLVNSWPFDYVLGSLHYLDGISVGNPRSWHNLSKKEIHERFQAYFYELGNMANSGLIQIAAHPDFIKLRTWDYFQAWALKNIRHISHALDILARNNVAIEVSSAGLRQDFYEPYPSPLILELAKKHDVKICLGSDAHAPQDVGYGFDTLVRYCSDAGYDKAVFFIQKQPVEYTLKNDGVTPQ